MTSRDSSFVHGSLSGLRARDIMTEDPFWVEATTTLGEVARLLVDKHVRHLPVLEAGVVRGILSDRDIRTALPPLDSWPKWMNAASDQLTVPVSSVMAEEVLVIEPDRDVKDVVDLMLERGVGAIVVADAESNKLVGIISYVDLLRVLRDAVWR